MGFIRIFERGGDDAKRFDEAMTRAKSGLMEACEIWENMKDQFSERDGYGERGYGERSYGERGGYRNRDNYRNRDDWDEYSERRDRMGRYR